MELYGDDPDKIGYSTGVTTVIDAGTTGADNIGDFYKKAKDSKTNVFAYLNISKTGIIAQNELGDLKNTNKDTVTEKLKEIKDFVDEAYKKGVIFDIGHGTDSFNFNTAEVAKNHQLVPYTLSTDIYRRNRSEGPVYDFPTTIEKMLVLGYSMEEILPMITSHPAEIINLKNKGQLKEGYDADITIFKLKKADKKLVDSNGNIKNTKVIVQPTYTIVEGNLYNLGE